MSTKPTENQRFYMDLRKMTDEEVEKKAKNAFKRAVTDKPKPFGRGSDDPGDQPGTKVDAQHNLHQEAMARGELSRRAWEILEKDPRWKKRLIGTGLRGF